MNKFILKHSTLVTSVILAILAWFIYRQFIVKGSPIFPFAAIVVVVWIIGTFVFIYLWPNFTYSAYKRAILQYGLGDGPIPINTLYAAPFLSSPSASASSLMATGTDYLLYIGGWLDLTKWPLILHVPDFSERYYSLQFTDPSTGENFAYVGKRTSGTQEGDFVISGPNWQGSTPQGMKGISSPNRYVLVVGRVLVEDDSDVEAAYDLAKQVRLNSFS